MDIYILVDLVDRLFMLGFVATMGMMLARHIGRIVERIRKLEDSQPKPTEEKNIYEITEALENIIYVPLTEDEVLKIIEYFKSRDKPTEVSK